MQEFMIRTYHRPRPLPAGRWRMTQRWNDLLFAHWPVSASQMDAVLPAGLQADTYQGSAWLGVVPFWLDRIKLRGIPPLPGTQSFPDLNVRTYVRDRETGNPGMYFFSLDASNLLAVAVARMFFHLPCHWAEMHIDQRTDREFAFYSRRRLLEEAGGLSRRAIAGSDRPGNWPKRAPARLSTSSWSVPVSSPSIVPASPFGRTFIMSRGRWRKLKPKLTTTTWPRPSASSFPTRSPSCTTRAAWRSTSGPRSCSGPCWRRAR